MESLTRKLKPGIHIVNIKGKRRKVRVNAKGQWRFMKMGRSSTTSRTRRSSPSPRRRGVRRLTRRRRYTRKRRRRGPRTIPILPLAGLGAAVAEPVRRVVSGDVEGGLIELVQRSTGVCVADGSFNPEWLKSFWVPVIVGIIGHKVANMLGLNRVFSRLPSPLNKLRL